MTAILLGDYAPDSPEWHALRKQGIGASEIAAVVGLSPFESPFSLWHRKKGNLPGPDPANPLFYWGHALEPLVAARYAEEHGDVNLRICGTYASVGRLWQFANPDRLITTATGAIRAVLEIKTTRYPDNWGPTGSTDIPLHVRCQVMQQMDVMDVPFAHVAVLIGGNDYREYRIDFNEDDARSLREAGAAFWESLQTDTVPPIDSSTRTYEAVREMHPDIDLGADVELDPDLWLEFSESKGELTDATKRHRTAKSQVLSVMGFANYATVNGETVLRRQEGRGDSISLQPVKPKKREAA